MLKRFLLFCCLLFAVAACARPQLVVNRPEDALVRLPDRSIPLADDLDLRDIAPSVRQSLEYYRKLPPTAPFIVGPDRVTAGEMAATLQGFLQVIEDPLLTQDRKMERIQREFVFYRAVGSSSTGKVLFTGYYEPKLSCRVTAADSFRYPLYRRPDDIVEIDLAQFGNDLPKSRLYGRLENRKVVPYYTRDEIDQKKVLANRDLEILWCSDPLDIYFLQVQGSGKVDLGDGSVLSVLYDGANGRPYKSIGKVLIESGALPKEGMSMQAIRAYLASRPDEARKVLSQNPSYVFFRLDTGPSIGNIGVPLTAGRSLATDSRLFPKGGLALIVAQKPVIRDNAITGWVPFSRFVMNQDTGGAIKGPGRADLFLGQGAEAELAAGNLQQEGELYFLVKRK